MMYSRRLLLALMLLITGTAIAQSLYRYRDAEGNWVYTDRKPDTVSDAHVEQLPLAAEASTPPDLITVLSRTVDDRVELGGRQRLLLSGRGCRAAPPARERGRLR